MPIAGSTRVGSSAGTPLAANVAMAVADTEYSYSLPSGTTKFQVQNREIGLVKLAFTASQSGVTYWTIFPGCQYWEEGVSAGSVTLYFQSPTAAQTLEIISWS